MTILEAPPSTPEAAAAFAEATLPVPAALDANATASAFAKVLAQVAAVAGRRFELPMFGNVRLGAAGDGRLLLTCGTMEATAALPVPGSEVRVAGGELLTSHRDLRHLLAHLKGDVAIGVTGEGEAQRLTLSAGPVRAQLQAPIEMDPLPVVELGSTGDVDEFSVSAAFLSRVASDVGFAASTDANRPFLNRVCLRPEGDHLVACATNGHRLGLLTVPLPDGYPAGTDILLPPSIYRVAARAFRGQAEVHVRFNGERRVAEFSCAGGSLTVRTCDGPYPNYRQVLPATHTKVARLSAAALDAGVAAALVVASPQTRRVIFEFDPAGVTVWGEDAVVGRVETRVEGSYSGDTDYFTIGFNGDYIRAALRRLSSPMVEFGMTAPERATVIRGVAPADDEQPDEKQDGESYLQLLMPLRILS